MFRNTDYVLAGLIGLVANSSSALAQVPTDWAFELQCRSSVDSGIATFNLPFPSSLSSQYVSIGDAGDVAMRVILGGSEGVFYGQNGSGSVIFSATAVDPVWSSTIDLRNGMIAIEMGNFGDGAQLYDTSGALLHDFVIGGPQGVSGFNGVTLTSDGALCFRGDFGSEDKLITDEFIGGVRTQALIADTFSGDYSFLFAPEINDARQVLTNTIPETGPSRRIVRFDSLGIPTIIAETGGMWNAFVNSTAISQNGDAAFSARRSTGSIWEVNHWDGSAITMIASGDDADISNSSIANFPPVVNSNGWVAFRATDGTHASTALWVGDGDSLAKLIEWDQIIETDLGPIALGFDFGGDTGRQLLNGVIDINDAGQVAFAAFLRNGTIGVFVATPMMDICQADLTGDGLLNFFDVSAFLSAFTANDPIADFTGDGLYNFFDVSAFLSAFGAGCP